MVTKNNPKIIEKIARDYANLLIKEIKVTQIYLYGSYVKGDFSEDSDIDIAVVGESFTGDFIEDTLKLMKLRRSIDNRISPHPFTEKEFASDDPFINEIKMTCLRII